MFKRQIYRKLFSELGLPLPLVNPGVLPRVPHTNTEQDSCLPKLILQTVSCCARHFAPWVFVSSQRRGVRPGAPTLAHGFVHSQLRWIRFLPSSTGALSICLNCLHSAKPTPLSFPFLGVVLLTLCQSRAKT